MRSALQVWSRDTFLSSVPAIVYIETRNARGDLNIGTGFHVGEGVIVTARHVVEGREIRRIGPASADAWMRFFKDIDDLKQLTHGNFSITSDIHFHENADVDVCCFKIKPHPTKALILGGHLDDFLGEFELLLHRTLVLGFPRIPLSDRPALVACSGEINALVDMYTAHHPHFIISTMARGGFSGAPVMVAYDEENRANGTAVLGLVTESLVSDGAGVESGFMAVLTVEPIYGCLERAGMLPEAQKIGPEQ